MLNVVVTDLSAQSRHQLVDYLYTLINNPAFSQALIPKISVRPLAPQELSTSAPPEILIVGSEIVSQDFNEIARIRRIYKDSFIFAKSPQSSVDILQFEQLVQLGVDEVCDSSFDSQTLLKRILLLIQKKPSKKTGKLIVVDSSKGGSGTTTVVAAIGDLLSSIALKTALVDLDFETQDLTRFLRVRPVINDQLQLLLSKTRRIDEDHIRQCLSPVWESDDSLVALPPTGDYESLFDSKSIQYRSFFQVLQTIDSLYDVHIVDTAHARGNLQKSLYKVADKILFVVQNDPASIHASVEKIKRVAQITTSSTKLNVLINQITPRGIPYKFLKNELAAQYQGLPVNIIDSYLPYCEKTRLWPGSGFTPATLASQNYQRALTMSLKSFGFEIPENSTQILKQWRIPKLAQSFTGKSRFKTIVKMITEKKQKLLPIAEVTSHFENLGKDLGTLSNGIHSNNNQLSLPLIGRS